MRKYLFTAAIVLFAGNAAASEFLPLNAGDTASFATAAGNVRELRVDDSAGSWRHVQATPLPGAGWLSSEPTDSRVFFYNEENNSSVLLADFARNTGTRFNFSGGCNNSATIGAKNLSLRVPAGNFQRVTRIDFGRNCADAGLISAWFAPQVGLVKWSESNIAGAQEYSLHSARIGATSIGQTAAAAPSIRVSGVLPGPTVLSNVTPRVSATLKVENTGTQEQRFTCPSTQQFDIALRNAQGDVVNTWSATRRFAQIVTTFALAPGASKEVGGEIDLTSLLTNAPLEIGSYSIEIQLRCHIEQQASAFLPVPSYSVQGPIFVDQRVTHF